MKTVIVFAICITGTLAVTSNVLGLIKTGSITQQVGLNPTVNKTFVGGSGSTLTNSSGVQRNLAGDIYVDRDQGLVVNGANPFKVGPLDVPDGGSFVLGPDGLQVSGGIPITAGENVNSDLYYRDVSISKDGTNIGDTGLNNQIGSVTTNSSVTGLLNQIMGEA